MGNNMGYIILAIGYLSLGEVSAAINCNVQALWREAQNCGLKSFPGGFEIGQRSRHAKHIPLAERKPRFERKGSMEQRLRTARKAFPPPASQSAEAALELLEVLPLSSSEAALRLKITPETLRQRYLKVGWKWWGGDPPPDRPKRVLRPTARPERLPLVPNDWREIIAQISKTTPEVHQVEEIRDLSPPHASPDHVVNVMQMEAAGPSSLFTPTLLTDPWLCVDGPWSYTGEPNQDPLNYSPRHLVLGDSGIDLDTAVAAAPAN